MGIFYERLEDAARSTCLLGATPALVAPKLGEIGHLKAPTCPDTSLPWQQDSRLGGWSARMFLHQMLSTGHLQWNCSDTELYISRSTLAILRVNLGKEITASHALMPTPPDASSSLYLSRAMLRGLAKRSTIRTKQTRPLQHVLQRTKEGGLQRRRLTFSKRGSGFVPFILTNANDSKDLAGRILLDFLTECVGECAATQ